MLAVQDLDTCTLGDVASRDNARTFRRNRQTLWPFDFHANGNTLEVQDDVGDVFAHTGNG